VALVTVAQLASFLKRSFSEADAATAQLLIDGASELVVEYCGWHIAPSQAETVTVDGSGSRVQGLPTMRLTAVNTVTETGTALTVADLDWSENGLLEKQDGTTWTGRRRGVVANITHGYTAAPNWLVTLVCAVAGRPFLAAPGVVQEAAGGESVTYAQPSPGAGGAVLLLPVEQRMLDRIAVPGAA
jgi:hypothetical protein